MKASEVDTDPRLLPIPAERAHEIGQFLYREARLLDQQQWRAWLGLFTPDLHYWVPAVQSRYRRDGGITTDDQAIAFFDDTLETLTMRITRFEQETAWAEDPPTRCAHLVSNIDVVREEPCGEYLVESIVVLHRSRNADESSQSVARRSDSLRLTAAGWRISRRHVFLLETVLLSKNLNTFF